MDEAERVTRDYRKSMIEWLRWNVRNAERVGRDDPASSGHPQTFDPSIKPPRIRLALLEESPWSRCYNTADPSAPEYGVPQAMAAQGEL